MRLSGRADFREDLYLAVRELVDRFEETPRSIRTLVRQALANTPPADLRERFEPGQEEAA